MTHDETLNLFKNQFLTSISPTKHTRIKQGPLPHGLSGIHAPNYAETEQVVAFYVPESQVENLINEATRTTREQKIMWHHPQIREAYMQYQVLLNLYR